MMSQNHKKSSRMNSLLVLYNIGLSIELLYTQPALVFDFFVYFSASCDFEVA